MRSLSSLVTAPVMIRAAWLTLLLLASCTNEPGAKLEDTDGARASEAPDATTATSPPLASAPTNTSGTKPPTEQGRMQDGGSAERLDASSEIDASDETGVDTVLRGDAGELFLADGEALSPILPVSLDAGSSVADGGTVCVQNRDCVDSPEALALRNVRCPQETYCAAGRCRAHCSQSCQGERVDFNPCDDGSYCQNLSCRYRPLTCQTAERCPTYRRPLADGTRGEWTCEAGYCAYPEHEYSTQE